MEIFIDSANIKEIKDSIDFYNVEGITTNPSILTKEKNNYEDQLKLICESINNQRILMVQVLANESSKMIEESIWIKENFEDLCKELYVKIPATKEGLKAMRKVVEKGINVTATAVITPLQALMCAREKVSYVAPYVNRIDNLPSDGILVIKEIKKIFKNYNLDTKILAASFKNTNQVLDCLISGADAITVSYEILEAMQDHLLTKWSCEKFENDWENYYNKKTIF